MVIKHPEFQEIETAGNKYLGLCLPGMSAVTFYAACFVQQYLDYYNFSEINPVHRETIFMRDYAPILNHKISEIEQTAMIDPAMVYYFARKLFNLRVNELSDVMVQANYIVPDTIRDYVKCPKNANKLQANIYDLFDIASHTLYDYCHTNGALFTGVSLNSNSDKLVDNVVDALISVVERNNPKLSARELSTIDTLFYLSVNRMVLFNVANGKFDLSKSSDQPYLYKSPDYLYILLTYYLFGSDNPADAANASMILTGSDITDPKVHESLVLNIK